jgi:filamentous hemagglutinin family protein
MNFILKFTTFSLGIIAAIAELITGQLLSPPIGLAQITPDETLGTERSQVNRRVVRGQAADAIDGGAQRGANLFHSFRDFNVNEGQRVYFSNPAQVENIFSRVTGGDVSNILGTLGVDGVANLFLLNPNGIIFGPNARLDISGSFLATTADRFTFPDGSGFGATDPQAPPLLTVNVPIGLQYGTGVQGEITNLGELTVGSGQTLALNGSTIYHSGALVAPAGRVELTGDRIALLNQSRIDVSGESGGGTVLAGGSREANNTRELGIIQYPSNALQLWMAPTATIEANAINSGQGGEVLIGTEQGSRINGRISARGGNNGGNGGFVETSGQQFLEITTPPDIAAPAGVGGTWLIDPNNINIVVDGSGTFNINPANPFETTGDTAQLEVGLIRTALGFGDVIISTTTSGTNLEEGNINWFAPFNYDGIGVGKTLTLNAHNNITLFAPFNDGDNLTPDSLNLVLNANSDRAGFGSIITNAPISTSGGSFFARGDSAVEGGILTFAPIDTDGGAITMIGTSAGTGDFSRGIELGAPLFSDGGDISLTGVSAGWEGIINFSVIFSSGGNITLNGTSTGTGNFADGITTAGVIFSEGGNLTLIGNGASDDIITFDALDSGNGTLSLETRNLFLSEFQLERLFGNTIDLRATNNITIADAFDNQLKIPEGIGTITLTADADGDRVGTLTMQDLNDTLVTSGRTLFLSAGANPDPTVPALLLGEIDSTTFTPVAGGLRSGSVNLRAIGDIRTSEIRTTPFSFSDTGSIRITSLEGSIDTTAGALLSGARSGNAGSIYLEAQGDIRTTDVFSGRNGTLIGGDLTIISRVGSIDTTAASPFDSTGSALLSRGDQIRSGQIRLSALGNIRTNSVSSEGGGTAGNIVMTAGGDIVSDRITSLTYNTFANDGGSVNLVAGGDVRIANGITTLGRTGGDVLIDGNEIFINGGIATFGDVAGNVVINADANFISNEIVAFGDIEGGSIIVDALNDIVINRPISTYVFQEGNSGEIALTSGGLIEVDDIQAFVGSGDAGTVTFSATEDITVGNVITTASQGRSGTIQMTAGDRIATGNLLASGPLGRGDITLTGNILEFVPPESGSPTASSLFLIDASGGGVGGNISLTSRTEDFTLTNGLITSNTLLDGSGGSIQIQANSVNLTNTDITTTTAGVGDAGSISMTTVGDVLLTRSRLFTSLEPGGIGSGGDITLDAQNVSLRDFSLIDTATFGQGDAGRVLIQANALSLDNSSIFSIAAGQGEGGDVTVRAADGIALLSRSNISTAVSSNAIGNGGDITLRSRTLEITGGSQLQALTRGQGQSGNIQLNVTNNATISGIGADGFLSGIFTSAESSSQGRGGNIEIRTGGRLRISDGAVLNAQTSSASRGGNIAITSEVVELRDGGQVLTNTFGDGRAGDINVTGSDRILLTGVDANFASRPTPRPRTIVPIAPFTPVLDIEPNNDITQAQALTSFTISPINLANPDVEFSTRIPYVSISGTGSDPSSYDYYAFQVETAGTRGIFDIDYGNLPDVIPNQPNPEDVDTIIRLFDSNGNLLAANDGAPDSLGASGSFTDTSTNPPRGSNDAYLRYVFSAPGTYFVQVDDPMNQVGVAAPGTYQLQVSLETPNVAGSVINNGASSGLFARSAAAGAAGNITLNTSRLIVQESAQIAASTSQSGQGGNLAIAANDSVTLSGNSLLSVETTGTAAAGNFNLDTPLLTIEQGARITASTAAITGAGIGGNLLFAVDELNLSGQTSGIFAETTGSAVAGNLTMQPFRSNSLVINFLEGAQISAATTGSGAGGNIRLIAPNAIALNGDGRLSAESSSTGLAGNLRINTNRLSLDRTQVSVSSTGTTAAGDLSITANDFALNNRASVRAETLSGSGGNIQLSVRDSLRLNNSQVSAATQDGVGGNLILNGDRSPTNTVQLLNNSQLITLANGSGNAGDLSLNTRQLSLRNSEISAASQSGIGGDVDITAEQVTLTEAAEISASTRSGQGGDITFSGLDLLDVSNSSIAAATSTGEAGSLTVMAADAIRVTNRGSLSVAATAGGDAGSLSLRTSDLQVSDNAAITVSSVETGSAGNLSVIAQDVSLNDRARLTAETEAGRGASIDLQVSDSLTLTNRSEISASTIDGRGGQLQVNGDRSPTNSIQLTSGSELATAATGQGDAGNLELNTRSLTVTGQNSAVTATSRSGIGGRVAIAAEQVAIQNGGAITATTRSGNGRGITLQGLNTLTVDNGEISASTLTGQAGSLDITASESIRLTDSASLAVQATGRGGRAGDLTLRTGQVEVQNGSISVSSPEGQAGNLSITTNAVRLDQGRLTAETGQPGEQAGAVISLEGLDTLVMRNGSLISASALEDANGGNVTLNVNDGFIIGPTFENNDIIANAQQGNGGRINITTQGIFGLEFREALTPLSDITASSQFGLDGEVIIETPNTDPDQGLVELPGNLIDAASQISQSCSPTNLAEESAVFHITGRGGLPPSPTTFQSEAIAADLGATAVSATPVPAAVPMSAAPAPLIEAQSWVVNAAGQVMLVADASIPTAQPSGLLPPQCTSRSPRDQAPAW